MVSSEKTKTTKAPATGEHLIFSRVPLDDEIFVQERPRSAINLRGTFSTLVHRTYTSVDSSYRACTFKFTPRDKSRHTRTRKKAANNWFGTCAITELSRQARNDLPTFLSKRKSKAKLVELLVSSGERQYRDGDTLERLTREFDRGMEQRCGNESRSGLDLGVRSLFVDGT